MNITVEASDFDTDDLINALSSKMYLKDVIVSWPDDRDYNSDAVGALEHQIRNIRT